jgi:rhodanese-related sulfurtransferase
MNPFTALFGKTYQTVSPKAARRILDAGGILVDVRSRIEWDRGHAPEAIHIPLELVGRADDRLPEGVPVVTMCRSGHRSAVAARILAAQGRKVSSISGGLPEWSKAGEVVQREDDH